MNLVYTTFNIRSSFSKYFEYPSIFTQREDDQVSTFPKITVCSYQMHSQKLGSKGKDNLTFNPNFRSEDQAFKINPKPLSIPGKKKLIEKYPMVNMTVRALRIPCNAYRHFIAHKIIGFR